MSNDDNSCNSQNQNKYKTTAEQSIINKIEIDNQNVYKTIKILKSNILSKLTALYILILKNKMQ